VLRGLSKTVALCTPVHQQRWIRVPLLTAGRQQQQLQVHQPVQSTTSGTSHQKTPYLFKVNFLSFQNAFDGGNVCSDLWQRWHTSGIQHNSRGHLTAADAPPESMKICVVVAVVGLCRKGTAAAISLAGTGRCWSCQVLAVVVSDRSNPLIAEKLCNQ
jgi:hypothetical protein